MRSNGISGASALALSWLASVGAAHAAPDPAAEGAQTGEVIVTAQKREERINDVGMSISAVNAELLNQLGVANTDDLAKVVPGFVAAKSAYGVPVYTLRGVGFYDYSLGATPAVTVYVDQVPLPYSQMAQFAALDLERVEVLKGPQGTLYGLNSTAGAVNYIAAKPSDTFEAGLGVTVGSYEQTDARAFVSGPLSDTLAFRLSAATEQGGGWQDSISRGESNGDRNRTATRLLLDWTPTSKLSALLNVNWGQDKSDSMALQFQQVTPLNPTNAVLRALRPLLVNTPRAPASSRAADWDANSHYRQDNENFQTSATISYDITDDLTVRNLTSWQRYLARSSFDGDGTVLTDFIGNINGELYAFYQETALYGGHDKLQWIVGANYVADGVDQRQLGTYPYSFLSAVGSSTSNSISDQSSKTYAVFGNLDYALTEILSVQFGARYTDATRRFEGCTTAPDAASAASASVRLGFPIAIGGCTTIGPSGRPTLIRSELNEDNVAWRAGVDWKFVEDGLLYANVSHGYKSGAYPLLGASNYVQLRPVTQEDVVAYEVGVKKGFGGIAQLNAAAFLYDYTDKQVRGRYIDPVNGALSALVNVPKSEIAGIESQLVLTPDDHLTIRADVTYLQTEITDSYRNYDFLGTLRDFQGQALPFSPELTANLSADYRWSVGDNLEAMTGFAVSHSSSSNAGLGELQIARIDDWTTLDLSASIGAQDGGWTLRLWGRNVTDEYRWNSVIMVLDAVTRSASPPATYGVTLDLKF